MLRILRQAHVEAMCQEWPQGRRIFLGLFGLPKLQRHSTDRKSPSKRSDQSDQSDRSD